MNFYPVYKICRYTGAFTRIGSLMESCQHWGGRITPYFLDQARTVFARGPGEMIVLGPRCVDRSGKQSVRRGMAT